MRSSLPRIIRDWYSKCSSIDLSKTHRHRWKTMHCHDFVNCTRKPLQQEQIEYLLGQRAPTVFSWMLFAFIGNFITALKAEFLDFSPLFLFSFEVTQRRRFCFFFFLFFVKLFFSRRFLFFFFLYKKTKSLRFSASLPIQVSYLAMKFVECSKSEAPS